MHIPIFFVLDAQSESALAWIVFGVGLFISLVAFHFAGNTHNDEKTKDRRVGFIAFGGAVAALLFVWLPIGAFVLFVLYHLGRRIVNEIQTIWNGIRGE